METELVKAKVLLLLMRPFMQVVWEAIEPIVAELRRGLCGALLNSNCSLCATYTVCCFNETLFCQKVTNIAYLTESGLSLECIGHVSSSLG